MRGFSIAVLCCALGALLLDHLHCLHDSIGISYANGREVADL
jgi:hypothetical protein